MESLESVRSYDRVDYPSIHEVNEARKIMKPPGILSNAYNKFQLKKVERERAVSKSHPLARGKYQQTDTLGPCDTIGPISYFKSKTTHENPSVYDRVNSVKEGYDQKLHRDDREHHKAIGLSVNKEETSTAVPLLSSSVYGHPRRKPLEFPSRQHGHVEVCQKDFLRLTGVNLSNEE